MFWLERKFSEFETGPDRKADIYADAAPGNPG